MSDNGHSIGDVHDLDVLAPDPIWVKVLGHKLNVGFIPAIMAARVERYEDRLARLAREHIGADGTMKIDQHEDADLVAQMFELELDIVSCVVSAQAPELTRDRLASELTHEQFQQLLTLIIERKYGPATAALNETRRAEAAENGGAEASKKGGPISDGSRTAPATAGTGSTTSTASRGSTTGRRTKSGR